MTRFHSISGDLGIPASGGIKRRDFLRLGGMISARLAAGSSLFALGCEMTPFGPLQPPDANGIRLPPRFRSRVIARQGDLVPGTNYVWHRAPDGGATFRTHTGWIYVSNSEVRAGGGGVGAIAFDHRGEIVDAYSICSGTRRNCAGGATPWGTWLSCEEVATGFVHECDPSGETTALRQSAMGRFNHEAVAVDPTGQALYLTEDARTGGLYRFLPNSWGNLSSGSLEIAEMYDVDNIRWHRVPNPTPFVEFGQTATRFQIPQSFKFNGGEGIVHDRGKIYFTTKGDNRVWEYVPQTEKIRVLYDDDWYKAPILTGVDNIEATRRGDLIVAEDGGNMELVVISKHGLVQTLLRVMNQGGSEITGPAFGPVGNYLYFSSQRGTVAERRGLTYEITGPFGSRI